MGGVCESCRKSAENCKDTMAGDTENPPRKQVLLSKKLKAKKAVVKGNQLSGEGSCVGNAQIMQIRIYYEAIVVNAEGSFCMGVRTKPTASEIEKPLQDQDSCWSRSFNSLEIGDAVGMSFDQTDVKTELRWFVNGKKEGKALKSKKISDVYPAFSVTGGSVVEVKFDDLKHLPEKFEELILAIDLI